VPRAAVDAFLRGHCWPLCDLTALTNLRLRACGLDAGARRAPRAPPARRPALLRCARPAAAARGPHARRRSRTTPARLAGRWL